MDKKIARVEDDLLIINDICLRMLPPLDEELLKEIAKRWNAHKELMDFLERAGYVFNCALLRTPTSEERNMCTDLNIERITFITQGGNE